MQRIMWRILTLDMILTSTRGYLNHGEMNLVIHVVVIEYPHPQT